MTRDSGLQAERTGLAWRRTLLAVTVVTALAVRLALARGVPGTFAAGLALAGWLAVAVLTRRRSAATDPGTPPGRTLPLVALATAGYALLGVLLIVPALA